jgi:putative peptide zinc metalloprotease protein
MELWRRVLFVVFAVVSWVYRWVITFVILKFLSSFLKPYKLEIVSNMLAAAALGSMVGWPLFRLGKSLHKRGRLPDMKMLRTSISAGVVAVLVLAFFVVPLPISRVRETGLVQVQPRASVPVHVTVDGILEKVHVREGQRVKKGAVLATFTSLELKQQEDQARTDYVSQDRLAHAYAAQLTQRQDPDEVRQLQLSKTKAESERDKARQKWLQVTEEARTLLTLVAPRDGTVIGVPKVDEVGKRWEKDLTKPFCQVIDPTQLRVLTPLSPDDYNPVRENLQKFQAQHQDLAVTIRVLGRETNTWQGRVSLLPESAAKEVPPALSSKLGGPLAVKNGGDPEKPAPQNQVYLVGIDLLAPDNAICPGQLAQVKIHCEYHSCGWWVWRSLSRTFDLGLL